MDLGNLTAYYIGLLAIQITGITLISAGVLALYQIYGSQTPKRDFTAVVSKRVLTWFFLLDSALIILSGLCVWSIASTHNFITAINFHSADVDQSPVTSLFVLGCTFVMYGIFFWLLWQSRSLLDTKKYLDKLSQQLDNQQLSDYLFHTYSTKPNPYVRLILVSIGVKKTSKKKEAEQKAQSLERIKQWEKRYGETEQVANPLTTFVDYCRANAVNDSGDVESVGLPTLERLLLAFAQEFTDDTPLLLLYLDDVTREFKEALAASSLMVRKRYVDVLAILAIQFCQAKQYDVMAGVASKIYDYVKGESVEELKRHAVAKLREVTEAYCDTDKKEKDWRKFDHNIEELALAVARIAEDYYLNVGELSPISVIENNRTELNDIGGEIANYFASYENLHEKYPDILPVIYFDAVDVSAEAMIGAIDRSSAVKNDMGLSRSRYEQTVDTLYFIFDSYAEAALKNNNPDLLKGSVYRLTRGLKFMHDKAVSGAALDIADLLVRIGVRIACSETLKDTDSYGGEKLTDQIIDCINQYADHDKLAERKSSIEHDLFLMTLKDETRAFENRLIGW